MSVMSLYPYLSSNNYQKMLWVFDDERLKLKGEAFVSGMSEMITALVIHKGIKQAAQGFKISFSDQPFDHDIELYWTGAETFGWEPTHIQSIFDWVPLDDEDEVVKVDMPVFSMKGNWYEGEVAGDWMEGWLCPALLLYFQEPPDTLYIKAEPLPKGIDPIWHNAEDGKHFLSAK